jgi:uncharacterized membrane protein YidH (DUF202 family)
MTVCDGAPGVSNERTALAWQRTALSLLAGAAIMARLTWSDLGALAAILLGGAVALSGWVFWESRGRYAHHAGTRPRPGARGGRAPGALTAAIVLIALTELAALAVT